jgi:SAM-dependent methyltransferase
MPTNEPPSLLSYYRRTGLNPGEIAMDSAAAWESHVAKRTNLYENHLCIPLGLLRDRSVLEFGSASGENALVLAAAGANLTLVEPNQGVWPRLRALFERFGLQGRLEELRGDEIGQFRSSRLYELVVAEGFVFTLPDRDAMVRRMGELLSPGGLAVVSFNDRYGMFVEATKRLVLRRACELAGVADFGGDASLDLARRLFGESHARLNASRAFEVWWKDTLVNPFLASRYLWSYPEILPLVEEAGCRFHATSPPWTSADHFRWYKNVQEPAARHRQVLDDWRRAFGFFVTGLAPRADAPAPSPGVLEAVLRLLDAASEYTSGDSGALRDVAYPAALDDYLGALSDERLRGFNAETKGLYEAVRAESLEELLGAYRGLAQAADLWGSPYQYLCFTKRWA